VRENLNTFVVFSQFDIFIPSLSVSLLEGRIINFQTAGSYPPPPTPHCTVYGLDAKLHFSYLKRNSNTIFLGFATTDLVCFPKTLERATR
jgi:hypothetical protein